MMNLAKIARSMLVFPLVAAHQPMLQFLSRWALWGVRLCLATSLFVAVLGSASAQARSTLNLDNRHQPVPLLDWGDFWIDNSGTLTAAQVAKLPAAHWRQTNPDLVFKLEKHQGLWIRFTVPPAPDRDRWYVALPNPSIDKLDLYTLDLADQWIVQSAGDKVPARLWPLPYRYPLLPIAVSAEVPTEYLLRLSNNEKFTAPLQFANESLLSFQSQSTALAMGLFFGLVVGVALLSIFSAVWLRDQAFGLFALSLLLMALAQASSSGFGHLYLWPKLLGWNDFAYHTLKLLALSTVLVFAAAALSVHQRSMVFFRLVQGLALCGVAAALAMVWLPPLQRQFVFIPLFLLMQVAGVLLTGWSWWRGDPFAPWLLLSYVPLMLVINTALATQAVPMTDSLATQYALGIGIAWHLPIGLSVLVLRSKRRWENMRRTKGLDRLDPSTGLVNGGIFESRLLRMIARSERLRYQSVVLLIDIVNTAQIQRDFGRKAAEDLPLRLAHRLQSTVREIDSVARLSDLRFGMLVEGPCSAQDAMDAGPQIVARCMMPYPGLHPECVVQVHVAYAIVPEQGSNGQGVLVQLEARLNQVPENSKRAVFSLVSPKT